MKAFAMDFTRAEKTPSIMEAELNAALAQGQFKGSNQSESTSTGRVIYTIFVDESQAPKTKAKVFRESSLSELSKKMNEFLSLGGKIVATNQTSSSKSNNLVVTLFYSEPAAKGGAGTPAVVIPPKDETPPADKTDPTASK